MQCGSAQSNGGGFCTSCGASLASAPGAAPSGGVSQPEQVTTGDVEAGSFDVVLLDPGRRKINVIKSLRQQTGLGLREAKALVDAGGVCAQGLTPTAADALVAALVYAGADANRIPGEHAAVASTDTGADAMPARVGHPGLARLRGRVQKALTENLSAGEEVRVVVRGAHGQAIVGTDTRLFVCKPGFMAGASFGSEITTWSYRNLAGIQVHKGLASGSVIVQAPGQTGVKSSYWGSGDTDPSKAPNAIPVVGDWAQVKREVARLQELIDLAHTGPASPPPSAASLPPASLADEIRKLADLREAGALTEEEFQQAKRHLMGGS
jgi:ribosomal protein L7/L12